MVRLRLRCRCIFITFIVTQILLGFWFLSQPYDPAKQFLKRLFNEGGQSILHLTDQSSLNYFVYVNNELCVKEGTIIEKSSNKNCECRDGWTGRRCGMPEIIRKTWWMHNQELLNNVHLRKKVRRVVLLSPFSKEFDVFESSVFELNGLIDVFIIGEVNSTRVDVNKTLPILNKLKGGWLKDFQDKIIYVPVKEKELKQNSFVQILMHTGLRLISDIRPDDVFILTSGEEILNREVVLFLKLFQGYPLPVKCQFKDFLYGFYWSIPEVDNITRPKVCATSFQFLANAFEYQLSRLEEGSVLEEDLNFFTAHEQPIVNWTISDAGWRCHLCLPVQQIFQKLRNNPLNSPKWFLPDSYDSMLPFIQRLVKFGQNENLDPVGKLNNTQEADLPLYIVQNKRKFKHLLRNPYETPSIHVVV